MLPMFSRLEILTGPQVLAKLNRTKVLLLGVGGVGSWAAEAMVRNGVGNLTIVDSDLVCVTNINRQLQATHSTIGLSKVQALRERLSDINPQATIQAIDDVYSPATAERFDLDAYDYVVDAIDSLSSKVELIQRALQSRATLFSSMGAACKLDPSAITAGSFWSTVGCPLAKFVRKRLRKRNVSGDFLCVYSAEMLPQHAPTIACGSGNCACPAAADGGHAHEWCSSKQQINGSAVHITGIFGFYLAAFVTNHVMATAV